MGDTKHIPRIFPPAYLVWRWIFPPDFVGVTIFFPHDWIYWYGFFPLDFCRFKTKVSSGEEEVRIPSRFLFDLFCFCYKDKNNSYTCSVFLMWYNYYVLNFPKDFFNCRLGQFIGFRVFWVENTRTAIQVLIIFNQWKPRNFSDVKISNVWRIVFCVKANVMKA